MRIAIITGGESGEREVSLKSAENIRALIDFGEIETFVFPEQRHQFITGVQKFDLVIPMIHGEGGEDGSLQGFLELLGVPYLFSGVSAHAIAIDKKFAKEIAAAIGIVSPVETCEFPAFVKPRRGGSSVMSKLCAAKADAELLMQENPDTEFMIESPIKGREFTVGIIEHDGKTIALPIIEIVTQAEFFDYESKYDPAMLATEICPADIDKTLADELQRQALLIHTHLGVRHMSRSDFILGANNHICFLEINTIPGMTNTSLIPKAVTVQGLSMREVLKEWCGGCVKKDPGQMI